WREVYPAEVFAEQFHRAEQGFRDGAVRIFNLPWSPRLGEEVRMMHAAHLHFAAAFSQASFIENLRRLTSIPKADALSRRILEQQIKIEIGLAIDLFKHQQQDLRIGFEATNQYYYLPIDLMEKVVNCD